MGQISRTALKAFFETNDQPTEAQFIDFIDSCLNLTDDGTPLYSIAANSIDNTELATIATQIIKGRTSAGTGNVEDLTMAQVSVMLNTFFEEIIERPTTQPAIAAGVLTIDLNNRKQVLSEPRLSVGTLTINEDFTWAFSNATNGDLASAVLSLTGTRIITFPADVLVSNASTLGTWAAPNLTLTAGTDDLIEFQFLRYKTNSKWLLKVGEVAS